MRRIKNIVVGSGKKKAIIQLFITLLILQQVAVWYFILASRETNTRIPTENGTVQEIDVKKLSDQLSMAEKKLDDLDQKMSSLPAAVDTNQQDTKQIRNYINGELKQTLNQNIKELKEVTNKNVDAYNSLRESYIKHLEDLH